MYNDQTMKNRPILILALLLAAAPFGPGSEAATPGRRSKGPAFRELQQPPADSAEARRLRIWLGIERTSNCRVEVQIADSSGQVVRHLLSRLMGNGFYNIYWDKRTDSGRYAAPGNYVVKIDDCGTTKESTVEAVYRPFENLTELTVTKVDSSLQIGFFSEIDSVDISFQVFTLAGDRVATVVADTLMSAGGHILPLIVDNPLGSGRYWLRLYINEGFVREVEFTYVP